MKVLVVDDKKENLYLVETILKANGYTTLSAPNGAEALEITRNEMPDLIISDILMPVMDGFTLCRELKKDSSMCKIPFIFYTATYTDTKDEELALNLGADKFMLKPLDPDEFMNNVEEVMQNSGCSTATPFQRRIPSESIVLKEYNEALIRKLEDKMAQTEAAEKELRKYSMELLAAKEKAELSDRLKTEFLAQISHEIRTPVNSAISYTNLIRDELKDMLTPELNDYFNAINSANKRLIRTIDLILNMSEIQIGTYQPIFRNTDLIKCIFNDICTEYANLAKKKGLIFNFECRLNDPQIYCDQYSVNQIFINLVDNALKYTKSGSIDVTIDKDKHDHISVCVSDTGIGMSPEFMDRIFEPFRQEEHGYTRRFDGNGLGLAIVKNYCDINGACISVTSEKHKGSSFTVTFYKKP